MVDILSRLPDIQVRTFQISALSTSFPWERYSTVIRLNDRQLK
ncbi:MAG: hypothetical protein JWR07_1023 [Nevskia sp.]|nr:hypothetical protein [Nevskia sp.]